MAGVAAHLLAALHVPQDHVAVGPGRDGALAVGRQGDGIDVAYDDGSVAYGIGKTMNDGADNFGTAVTGIPASEIKTFANQINTDPGNAGDHMQPAQQEIETRGPAGDPRRAPPPLG